MLAGGRGFRHADLLVDDIAIGAGADDLGLALQLEGVGPVVEARAALGRREAILSKWCVYRSESVVPSGHCRVASFGRG